MPIRIAIIGYGKIARDQHVPAIMADERYELVAVAGRASPPSAQVRSFASHGELIAGMSGRVDALAICTPPLPRHAVARDALAAGLHVLLEKPPAATLGEIEHLEQLARGAGRTLYAAWHAQHNAAVASARDLLSEATIRSLRIEWFEDVRKWHPGQEWIWAPGGFGVFDPGINALSIATRILPIPLFVREARLVFPANRQTPIAANLRFEGEEGAFSAAMDWRYGDQERWTIRVETREGLRLELRNGGANLLIDGRPHATEGIGEYPSIYDRFAVLLAGAEMEVDREPLRIVADAFLVGRREFTDPFE